GQRLRFGTQLGFRTPGFDLNDAGFLRRADERWTIDWVSLRSEVPNRWFRRRQLNVNYFSAWNFDGDRLTNGGNVNANATFVNTGEVAGRSNKNNLRIDARMPRGGPAALSEGFDFTWSWLNTDKRQPVALNMFNGFGWNGVGSSFHDHEAQLTFRPISAMT